MTKKSMDHEKAYGFLREDVKDLISHFEDRMDNFYEPREYKHKLEVLYNIKNQMETYTDLISKEVKVNEDYRLKGWDWAELADKLNIEMTDPDVQSHEFSVIENDILYLKAVTNYLKANYDNKEVIGIVKDHLRAMMHDGEVHDHYDAVWEGMLNIKEDTVFMQFVFAFLGHMWT